MKRSKEERARIHKERCKELKQIRAKMAEDLGIDLHQRECTYEGYCSGTCPKCKSEEIQINAALLKRQLEEANIKGRVMAAGLTAVAAVSLTGCGMHEIQYEGGISGIEEPEVLEGDTVLLDQNDETTCTETEEEFFLEGDIEYIDTEAEE